MFLLVHAFADADYSSSRRSMHATLHGQSPEPYWHVPLSKLCLPDPIRPPKILGQERQRGRGRRPVAPQKGIDIRQRCTCQWQLPVSERSSTWWTETTGALDQRQTSNVEKRVLPCATPAPHPLHLEGDLPVLMFGECLGCQLNDRPCRPGDGADVFQISKDPNDEPAFVPHHTALGPSTGSYRVEQKRPLATRSSSQRYVYEHPTAISIDENLHLKWPPKNVVEPPKRTEWTLSNNLKGG
ncbi:hypothetical protein BDK51DRAFT_46070 [Blyttiomyces helicus]|uniref:Uncharacterized protein n=1 Tax=Blyttiomyces helicus TaxID=388810 RepID=A0A4P9W0P8_9FUNG|nr:hypothetical protein BDK51DRAFT_46070 [Blyttiomyces helicus]|eukprot:RKO85212.1 hypothetical protein BDK51DRAFT_46070 [Blyttiomyces helicus]